MTEIKFTDLEFFIPHQTDKTQRDRVFRNVVLKFAIEEKIIDKDTADNWEKSIGKIYSLTNIKEGVKKTFTVGERNPFISGTIISIIYTPSFYMVVNFTANSGGTLNYSMVSLNNCSEIFYFKQ